MSRILRACALILASACADERAGDPRVAFLDAGTVGPDATLCSHLAASYLSAFPAATACTPGVSQCTAQRPIAAFRAGSAEPEGLCWAADVGYLDPTRTADLDARLARYTNAGCTIGDCPSPSPHETSCGQNARGDWVCGRF